MTINISIDMLEASNPKQAAIEQAKQAVTTILKIESLRLRDTEDEAHLTESKDILLSSLRDLRVVDVAPFIKPLIEQSYNEGLKRGVLEILEDRIDDANSTLNEKIIDTLALANIYECVDEKKSTMLNAQAYFFLGTGQNNKIDRIIPTLEHIQIYYSDAGDDRDDEFTLSISQMQDLDSILVVKTKDFLAETNHDEDLADRLAYLLESHEDEAVSTPLLHRLFEVRSEAGRAEYIQSLLDIAAEDGAGDDDIVTNPILAREGQTYGDLFQTVGHLAHERDRLNTQQPTQASLIPA